MNQIERTVYDLGFAWEWEFDADFVHLLQMACYYQRLNLLQITPDNLESILQALSQGDIAFRAFLDRASDTCDRFLPLIEWVRNQEKAEQPVLHLNRFRLARQAWNKAFCQDQFVDAGLPTPPTLVIPSYLERPDLSPVDLSPLGHSFYIKPAHGGGGKGVVYEATAWDQVLMARQSFPSDQYLLQSSVTPALLEGIPAWFRILFCAGEVYPCWWDTQTHIYTPLIPTNPTLESLNYYLCNATRAIAEICKLELFSTEIAYTNEDQYVIIDYINDPVDLRLQSRAMDGVPDEIVHKITHRIATFLASHA